MKKSYFICRSKTGYHIRTTTLGNEKRILYASECSILSINLELFQRNAPAFQKSNDKSAEQRNPGSLDILALSPGNSLLNDRAFTLEKVF